MAGRKSRRIPAPMCYRAIADGHRKLREAAAISARRGGRVKTFILPLYIVESGTGGKDRCARERGSFAPAEKQVLRACGAQDDNVARFGGVRRETTLPLRSPSNRARRCHPERARG